MQGAESIVPVLRNLEAKGWRSESNLCWRRMISKEGAQKYKLTGKISPYISLWAATAKYNEIERAKLKSAFEELDKAIAEEDKAVKRFILKKGEALVVDNFRMLHAREAFHSCSDERRMWRVWSWTDASFGQPPQIDKDALPGNILEAETVIQAHTK